MEVVPTDDGEDDGVIWLRCPDCGGFLPKIRSSSAFATEQRDGPVTRTPDPASGDPAADGTVAEEAEPQPRSRERGHRSAASETEAAANDLDTPGLPDVTATPDAPDPSSAQSAPEPEEPQEPLDEYAAMLADRDPATAVPYRPWSVYAAGDLIHHLAWDDVGVVVAKEKLPGNRLVVKVFFDKMGVARLIEGDTNPS
jgi:hypothetical protein